MTTLNCTTFYFVYNELSREHASVDLGVRSFIKMFSKDSSLTDSGQVHWIDVRVILMDDLVKLLAQLVETFKLFFAFLNIL